ncbi:MAG: insulinase family protein [Chlamydiota bacterium]
MTTPSFSASHERYRGFLVKDVRYIQPLALYSIELVHTKSGASIIHLQNEDIENVFSISLQTLPASSNGVAHILEHTVLCGSKKYPVKDPFFSMIRRSLHTFMNAFTGMDFTCYPASSENVTDFYNLLDVYLDAVFYPNLTKESFLQEGHRLEFAEAQNPATPLLYKGVVFNEMKGAMSSMESRFWQHLFSALFPDLTYQFNSGGDPAAIPLLTHEELIDFHQQFYSPANAIFYFYGNIDTKKHLDFLEEKLLKDAEKVSLKTPILQQPRFSEPITIQRPYPAKKGASDVIGIGFLTTGTHDLQTIMALTLLESILMDTDASPLKKAFLDFGIQTVDAYFETEISEVPFVLLCKGCEGKTADQICEHLFSTLRAIAKERIPQEKIQEALHSLEFSRKEISGDHYPYGLHLFMRTVLPKQHGVNLPEALEIDALFSKLKNQTKNPEFLPLLIHKYFLDNPHFVKLTLTPDELLLKEEEEQEQATLRTIKEHLTSKQTAAIVEGATALVRYQAKLENQSLDCLPKIGLSDVRPEAKHLRLDKKATWHNPIFTNQIVYIDACIALPRIPAEELPYLPFFADFFSEIGTKKRSFEQNLSFINAHFGGIDAYFSLNVQASDPEKAAPLLVIRGKALYKNSATLCAFLQEMLDEIDFSDEKRLAHLLAKEQVEIKSQMVSHAMHYAKSRARSGLSPSSYLHDLLYGFRYFQTVEKLGKNPQKSAQFLSKLFSKWKTSFFQKKIDWVITADEEHYAHLAQENFFGLLERPQEDANPFSMDDVPFSSQESEGWTVPSPVAFTALSMPALHYQDPSCAGLLAGAELMQNLILHKEIREKGGAYGSGADFDPVRGDITFRAYRDPHLFSTVSIFHQAVEEISRGRFTKQDLDDAILGVIQDLDQPISPGSEGLTAYLRQSKGITKTVYQTLRDRLLALTKTDIEAALTQIMGNRSSTLVSFASEAFLAKENQQTKTPLPIKKT